MPFLEGGLKGASTRNVRPRCCAGVIPGGNSGGGPPAANLLSAGEEKNCGSVRWKFAMASSCEGIVNQERVVGVRSVDDPLDVVQSESTCELAVAGLAGTPIATERLLLEQLLAIEFRKGWVAAGACRESHHNGQRDKLSYGSSHGVLLDRDGEGAARDEHCGKSAEGARSLRCSTSV